MANQVAPGTFEGGTESWFTVGSTISASEEQKHGGAKSLKVVPAGTGSFNGAGKESPEANVAGTKYLIKVWVWKSAAGKNIRLLYSDPESKDEKEKTVTSVEGWQLVEWEFEATQSAKYSYQVRTGETTTTAYFVDDMSVEAVAAAAASDVPTQQSERSNRALQMMGKVMVR